jgi:hypothetical protein
MALFELSSRLRLFHHGPWWTRWGVLADFNASEPKLSIGPWDVGANWQRWSPPCQPAEVADAHAKARREFGLALFDILREEGQIGLAKRLADLLDPARFVQEISHVEGCDRAHAACVAAEVRKLIHDKISSGGGGGR